MKNTLLLILILMTVLSAQSNQKVVRFNEETEAWLNGDRQKALDLLLKKEISGEPDITARYNIGYLYYLAGDFNNALAYFKTVLDEDDSYIYAYLQTARIHKKIGLIQAAYADLEKGLEEDDENVELLLEMADITHQMKLMDKTEGLYLKVLDISDDNVYAIAGLAEIYRVKGKIEEARNLLEGNPGLYPEAVILQEKARLYRDQGKNEESKNFLMQILLDYPNSQTWAQIRDTLRILYQVENFPAPVPFATYTYKIDPIEELDYKVTYGPLTLGWLKVRIKKPEIIRGKKVYPIIFFVDSNPSYGFLISLHHIYESYIDPETLNAVKSRLYTPGSDTYLVRVYNYHYNTNIFETYAMTDNGRFQYLVKDLPRKVQDSTSMLYYARGLVSDRLSGVTTVVIDEEYKFGTITYLNETEPIDVNGKEIQALKIFARADFKGVAGMTGDTWGWFSRDQQAVPLKGNVGIILGSISLEIDEEKTVLPDFHEND